MTDIPSEPVDEQTPPVEPSEEIYQESPDASEPISGERPKAPDLKTPSRSQRVMYTLFSPETRTGRFMRRTLRVLAVVVGLFALGLLVAYLLLYRPTLQQLENANRQATQTASELQKARQDLDSARKNAQTNQTQLGDVQSRLEVEVARSQILRSMNSITQARMALQANNKAGAVKNLDTAKGYLQTILPLLTKLDSQQAETLDALFTLTKTDLDRDLKLAAQDLDRLQSELERAETNILK